MYRAVEIIRAGLSNFTLPIWLFLCLILGGASAAGVLANGLLQLAGILLIAILLWRMTTTNGHAQWSAIWHRDKHGILGILAIIGAVTIWIIFQLIPLPSSFWSNLSGRDIIVAGDKLIGLKQIARPFSMQPNSTIISASWLIVPITTLLLTIFSKNTARQYAGYLIIIIAMLSALVGVIQIGQGPDSPAYFYAITNDNTSVGFFANSNHLATLYLCALLLCPWLFFETDNGRKAHHMLQWMGIGLACMLVLNLILNRSLAGYVLLIPTAAFVIFRHPAGKELVRRWPFSVRSLFGAVIAITLILGWFAFSYLGSFALGLTDPNLRLHYYAQGMQMARATFPLGSGLGTFRWFYTGFEDPGNLALEYVNHAHNDYIELLVEGGLFSLLILAALVIWFVARLLHTNQLQERQIPLQLSSAMIVAIIAWHSLGDYPARTAAIAAIGAFAIGNLASPPSRRKS
jgi:O-antigen ligase